jgi:hypothetical protein
MMAFQIPSPHFPTPEEASIDVEIVEGEGDHLLLIF